MPAQQQMTTRLHVVTGKGGTGKSTVAAALALALARGRRRVLLCEVEGRQGLAQMFDVPPLPYEERRLAVAGQGGEVFALHVDPEAALLEYLDLHYRLGRAAHALDRFGVVDFATTIAPGLRDVLLTGKVYEAVRRRRVKGRPEPAYDAVVLDAPPTGRITRFLNVNAEVAGLARVGPVRGPADAIMALLRSPRTAVHVVTLLEEMPVQETADAIVELGSAGLPVGAVIVNQVRRNGLEDRALDLAAAGRLDPAGISEGLAAAGIEPTDGLVEGLRRTAHDLAEATLLESELRKRVDDLDRPVVELPWLPAGVDLGGLYELAEELCEQGLG